MALNLSISRLHYITLAAVVRRGPVFDEELHDLLRETEMVFDAEGNSINQAISELENERLITAITASADQRNNYRYEATESGKQIFDREHARLLAKATRAEKLRIATEEQLLNWDKPKLIALEANSLAKKANRSSSRSNWIAAVSVAFAIASLGVAIHPLLNQGDAPGKTSVRIQTLQDSVRRLTIQVQELNKFVDGYVEMQRAKRDSDMWIVPMKTK